MTIIKVNFFLIWSAVFQVATSGLTSKLVVHTQAYEQGNPGYLQF